MKYMCVMLHHAFSPLDFEEHYYVVLHCCLWLHQFHHLQNLKESSTKNIVSNLVATCIAINIAFTLESTAITKLPHHTVLVLCEA